MIHAGIRDGIRYISASEIAAWKFCLRHWYLRYFLGLRPKHELPLEKRDSGTRVHLALQGWYVPEGMPQVDPREGIETAIMADRMVLSNHLLASGCYSVNDHADFIKLVKANDVERLMVSGYMEWLEETGADAYLQVIEPEAYLEAVFPELCRDDIRIVGKLDVRVRRTSDRVRMLIDHKTRDVMPKLSELQRDEQMLFYELLEDLTSSSEDDRCDGALYNVLRRSKRTATAKPPFYARHYIPHNTHVKRAFRRRLTATIRDMISVEDALTAGVHHLDVAYPNPGKDCEWRCTFARICTMFDDGSRVEDLLRDRYKSDDPLYYYGDLRPHDRTGD